MQVNVMDRTIAKGVGLKSQLSTQKPLNRQVHSPKILPEKEMNKNKIHCVLFVRNKRSRKFWLCQLTLATLHIKGMNPSLSNGNNSCTWPCSQLKIIYLVRRAAQMTPQSALRLFTGSSTLKVPV